MMKTVFGTSERDDLIGYAGVRLLADLLAELDPYLADRTLSQ
jgi:hypothetical protein